MMGPPDSGKMVLPRSWIGGAGLAGRAAWVLAGEMSGIRSGGGLAVLGALR